MVFGSSFHWKWTSDSRLQIFFREGILFEFSQNAKENTYARVSF